MLTHTGGTGKLTEDEIHRELSPKDHMKLLKDRKPEFSPGTRWNYSNYGFVLLGAVIENVTQKDYYECIQERIFDKVGMKNSDFHLKTEKMPNVATGFIRKRAGLKSNIETLQMRGSPAGGGYSTAEDLNLFAHALLEENKLLNIKSLASLSTPKLVTDKNFPAFTYTQGFQNGDRWFGHAGRWDGINSELRIFPKTGYIVGVMGNLDPPAASDLADYIDARLPTQ